MNHAGVSWRRVLWGVALAVSLLQPAVVQAQAPIPAQAFPTPAKLRGAGLAPGGRWLATITSVPGRRIGFLMIDLDGTDPSRFVEASDDEGVWREIGRTPRFQGHCDDPVYVDGHEGLVVRTCAADGSLVLRCFDFTFREPEPEPILRMPGFSGGLSPVRLPGSGTVVALNQTVHATTTVWFSPEMQQLQDKVNAKFPSRVNVLDCKPCGNPRAVVAYTFSDTDPGSWVRHQPEDDKWLLIGQARPDIDPRRTARVELHRPAARDGRSVPVWVTRPAGNDPRPAVVLVPGGPHLRGGHWAWDAAAQFLASRGDGVIEPEFRGSTGYGIDHFRAGWKQWGCAMQDDVVDALHFAVAKGWADASRACIVGSMDGGYASPWGLIRAPLLLVHGGRDRRVPIENGERMRDVLRRHDKVVEWVVYPEEGHGFQHLENELDQWRRVESFLAQHLRP